MTTGPNYEWDEKKRRSNIAKHRVDFTAMAAFEWDTARIEPDEDFDEPRWTAIGFIGPILYFVVYTERGGYTRMISLRKATSQEAKTYVEDRS